MSMRFQYMAFVVISGLSLVCAQASPLGDLALQMQTGEWRELPTNKFGNGSILESATGSTVLEYTDEAIWDPVDKKLYIIGTARGPDANYGTENQRWIVYSEASNAWQELSQPPFYVGFHSYDHAALDLTRRHYYVRLAGHYNRAIWRFDIKAGTWTRIPDLPDIYTCCAGLEYFPDMDRVAFVGDARITGIWLFNPTTNGWTSVPGSLNHDFGAFTEYSPVDKVLYYGGGLDTPTDFYKLDSAGNSTKLPNSPDEMGTASGRGPVVTLDPVTGKLILFDTQDRTHEFSPSNNTWKQSGTHPLRGAYDQLSVAAPIPEYGVIMVVKYDFGKSKVYLYKHLSDGSTRPAAPQALGVITDR